MISIFGLLYFILLIIYILIALFIVYHIVRFSLSKSAMAMTLAIFVGGFGLLLFCNIILFLSINWKEIIKF
jgi:hypothetical protein